MFRSFFTTIFRGSSAVLCAVTIAHADLRSLSLYYYAVCRCMCMSSVRVWCSCLLVICLWTDIITQYVAACVCHLCVFGVLVCWWSACELYVICACLVFLSAGDLLVNWQFTSRSPTDKNTKHAQMTYTCGHILRNNTFNERKSAGGIVTAQSTAEDPLKMVVKKDRNM